MIVSEAAMDTANFEELKAREVQAGLTFHLEDMEVCAATQRGMRSVGYEQGRLSHLEEPIWHFQKYLAAKIKAAIP
jgi:hypothetical protein